MTPQEIEHAVKFASLVKDRNEAEEFERLMVGDDNPFARVSDWDAHIVYWWLGMDGWDTLSGVRKLRVKKCLENLRERYPDLWEPAAFAGVTEFVETEADDA